MGWYVCPIPTIVSLMQRDERARFDAMISEIENLLMADELRDSDGIVDTKSVRRGDGFYVLLYTKCCVDARGARSYTDPFSYLYTKKDGIRDASTSGRVHWVKSSFAFLYGLLSGGILHPEFMRSRKIASGAQIMEDRTFCSTFPIQ